MPSPPRPRPAAAEALAAVAPLATRWIERLLAHHDPALTVPQYLALRAIERERISGSELARRTGVSGPAVSQLVSGLVAAGLVERRPDPDDRRRVLVEATEEGLAALQEDRRHRVGWLVSAMQRLPPEDQEVLARATAILRRLAEG